MKALKEKRISLRSLWRRGLVILSLFALVFASCNTSGDDSGSSSGNTGGSEPADTRVIERVEITLPTTKQYFGQLVDLSGVSATVYYHVPGGGNSSVEEKGETIKYEDAKDMFTVYPRVVTGGYRRNAANGRWEFIPYQSDYLVTFKKGGSKPWNLRTLTVPIDLESDWLFDDDVLYDEVGIGAIPPVIWPETDPDYGRPGFYANGLQLTGVPDMVQKTAIVDDDIFNFAGLTLNASYTNQTLEDVQGNNDPLHSSRVWKKIDFDYVTWSIMPEYIKGETGKVLDKDGNVSDKVCPGYIYITVGDYVEYLGGPSANSWSRSKPAGTYGITIRVPLNEVYTVKTIEVVGADVPAVKDYAFWEANTGGATGSWATKLANAGVGLNVQYTGGKSKTASVMTITKLKAKERIWHNDNPTETAIDHDFDIIPLAYPFTKKANPTPHITVYYRGAIAPVYVNVYTSLVGLDELDGIDGDASVVWGDRDNDIYYTDGMTEKQFTDLLGAVTVEYTTYHDSDIKKTFTLKWAGVQIIDSKYASYPAPNAVPYVAITDPRVSGGGTYTTNFMAVKDKIKKDGVSKAVTILHQVNSGTVQGTSTSASVYTLRGHSYPYFRSGQGLDPALNGKEWEADKLYTLKQYYIFDSASAKTQKKKGSVGVVWSKSL